ncbi:hypothetical protein FDF36_09735 [Bacteroides fragilis]|nr:hypothetical protein [Bacteroides fragilis]
MFHLTCAPALLPVLTIFFIFYVFIPLTVPPFFKRTLRLPMKFVIVGSFHYHQNYTTFIKKATTKSIF